MNGLIKKLKSKFNLKPTHKRITILFILLFGHALSNATEYHICTALRSGPSAPSTPSGPTAPPTPESPPEEMSVDVDRGLAPLNSHFTFENSSDEIVTQIEIDFIGDCANVSVFNPSDPIEYTYQVPGKYLARVAIVREDETVIYRTIKITVEDKFTVGNEISNQLTSFSDALKRGDKTAALNLMTVKAQAAYGPIFDKLTSKLPDIAGSFSSPQSIDINNSYAEYAINRNINGVDNIFIVYLMRDADGNWKIESL